MDTHYLPKLTTSLAQVRKRHCILLASYIRSTFYTVEPQLSKRYFESRNRNK